MSEEKTVRCEQMIPAIAVGDVAAAIDFYTRKLGFTEAWRWGDPPAHAAVMFGDFEVHLSASAPNPGGSWLYFTVDDVDLLHDQYAARDVDIGHAPTDQEWGMREMAVRDHVGNELSFATHTVAREPKMPIVREAVPVRLEKRLAAVLRDLAEHKGMDVNEVLEETLLHTFEPVGDGVASPHTRRDLRRIAELKEKHGLDYDCHASYRFVEETPAAED